MPRSPLQVLVYPFRFTQDGVRYAILRRGDAGFWQGIAGGAQDSETPLEAARRESPSKRRVSTLQQPFWP